MANRPYISDKIAPSMHVASYKSSDIYKSRRSRCSVMTQFHSIPSGECRRGTFDPTSSLLACTLFLLSLWVSEMEQAILCKECHIIVCIKNNLRRKMATQEPVAKRR